MTEATKKTSTSAPISTKECIFESAAYFKTNSDGRRVLAVSAALELIAKRVAGPSPSTLEAELKNLSKYADQIQAAAKLK